MCALERAARETSRAGSARLRQGTYDVIADSDLGDVGTDCSHDPRNLVTQHRRHRNDIVSSEQQVGVTKPRRLHVDKNFASYRPGDVHVFKIEASTDCINYKCLHFCLLFTP
jgi:hypothetical protein